MSPFPRPDDAPVRGIALMCFAGLCFVIMNTLVKHLAQTYPVPFIVWARYFFHVLLILVVFPRRVPYLLVSGRKGLQVARSVLVLAATTCMFFAVQSLPLADVVAVAFMAPLLATALSVVMLKEHVGPRRWAAVLAGFVGVLVVIRPGAGIMDWMALLPLGMALFYALYQITTRLVSGLADPVNSLFYTAIVGAAATSAAVPFFWAQPTPAAWAMLAATGIFGGVGHFAVIKAMERAAVSVITPFSYVEMVWATAAGLMVFGEFPDVWTWVGAGIVVASGIYVLHRESQRAGL